MKIFNYTFLILGLLLFVLVNSFSTQQLIKQNQEQDFVSYHDTIPGTTVTFDMVSVPGGTFMMGSEAGEKNHRDDESPQHKVIVDSFWIGKFEVTWDEYELFVFPQLEKENKNVAGVDAVSRPTPPYVDMSFGMGKRGYPAVNMTQYAALMYCKWLWSKTGDFYRLPTEAEWEFACRAGTQTTYSFGNDETQLGDYAWYNKNSKNKYQKVGTKKPNPWGLYDMHGNVAEYTLDQYVSDYYSSSKESPAINPWAAPSTLYPRVARGGAWNSDAANLRSAARMGSDPDWKQRDPQSPKSDWWNTDASFAGFRLVRPLKKPTKEQIEKYFATQPKDY